MAKLLAIDMDGTCLTDRKKISEKTMQALKKAWENGVIVVPTTGRAIDCLPRQLLNQGFFRYVISSNGARVYDTWEQKTLYKSLIPLKNAVNLLLEGKKRGLGLTARVENQTVVEGAMLNLKARLIYKKDTLNTIKTNDIIGVLKQMNCSVEEVQLFFFNKRKKALTKELVGNNLNYSASYGKIYVEIYSENASKGVALSTLAGILGIDKVDVISIGNGENDLTMFEQSGLKIAVENAVPMLKQKADVIVASNNNDGVAEAIEKYCL